MKIEDVRAHLAAVAAVLLAVSAAADGATCPRARQEYRPRSRRLRRRLELGQGHRDPAGRGLQRHGRPESPDFAGRRRRDDKARAGAAERPGHPRGPLVGRRRHYRGGSRSQGCRPRVCRGLRAGRRRESSGTWASRIRRRRHSRRRSSMNRASCRIPTDAVVKHFAQDLPEEEASIVAATQGPINASAFASQVSNVAWKTKPSWYIVSAQDGAIAPDAERFFAKRMKATTTELNGQSRAHGFASRRRLRRSSWTRRRRRHYPAT